MVFPFSSLAKKPVLQAEIGQRPVVVFYKKGVASPLDAAAVSQGRDIGTTGAFDRRLDGRVLDFEPRGGKYADRQTGSMWDITGRAAAGPLAGRQLRRVSSDNQFWFSVGAFYPNVKIVS